MVFLSKKVTRSSSMATMLLFFGSSHNEMASTAFSTPGPLVSPSLKGTRLLPADHDHQRGRRLSQGLRMSVPNSLDVLTSGLASMSCLLRGVTVAPGSRATSTESVRIAELYDIENSESCRAVRERITEVDLVVEKVIPVAAGSRNAALLPGVKPPVLVVTTTPTGDSGEEDRRVFEGTDAILSFLDESFSDPSSGIPLDSEEDGLALVKEKLGPAGMYVASLLRSGRGCSVSPSASSQPEQPLILYSYEGNQFCRLVREVLTELDIVYELRSAGKESPRRAELASLTGGSSQYPYLIDPNTGVSMSESADIVEYLYKNYASWTPPSELLEWVSSNVMSLAKPLFKVLAPLQAGEEDSVQEAIRQIDTEVGSAPIVVYTYEWSPFSAETTLLLDRIGKDYKEISLGKEWLPGLITEIGATKRAVLLGMTGQSSLPHIFIDGKPIGGLFNGSPGLLPMLKNGEFPQGTLDTTSSGNSLNETDDFQ